MWTRRLSELTLVVGLGLAASIARAEPPSPSGDALEPYRERFKQGMDLYEHGQAAGAVAIWEPIYRDLGEHQGYRLAYDLGVAYAALDDAPHAADRLQAFLNEVDARRARGEPLGPAVTKEEADTRARLAPLASVLGRVQVIPGDRPSVVRVDAGDPHAAGTPAWVAPGQHVVTFDPGTPDERSITVDTTAGAVVELVAPPPPSAARPAASAMPGVLGEATPSAPGGPGSTLPTPLTAPRSPPFSPALIAVSGGATLAATGAAVALEIHANSLRQDDIAAQGGSGKISADDRSSFATARTWAYVTVGCAVGLGALTAGLATWYFVGRAHGEKSTPTVGLGLAGSRLVLQGGF
jgi:hypothetical protein